VFGIGVPTIAKAVAHFLSTFKSLSPRVPGKECESFPDLIFLVNFNEMEYVCIEHWLTIYAENYYQSVEGPKTKKTIISLKKISNSDNSYVLNKRADLFLKGGAFAITYKQLVLDLLTKRLSPNVISGFIINNAHRIKPHQSESFLCKLLKTENSNAFIKVFTQNVQGLIRQGQPRIVEMASSLHLESISVYPRINSVIKKSLDNLPNLKFTEHAIEMSPRMLKIQQLLIKLV